MILTIEITNKEIAIFKISTLEVHEVSFYDLAMDNELPDDVFMFEHGDSKFRARIKDTKWLSQFKNNEIDFNPIPGSALKVEVITKRKYNLKGDFVKEQFWIERVLGVYRNVVEDNKV